MKDYIVSAWQDGTTLVDAEKMQNIEQGIADNRQAISDLQQFGSSGGTSINSGSGLTVTDLDSARIA